MDTQTQIDRLIELAIVQRSDLKKLISELPQLREHLNAEIERIFEDSEPQIRAELEDWTTKQAKDETAKLGSKLEEKLISLSKSLEATTQTRYNAIMAERAENLNLLAKAEARIEDAAAMLSGAVKEIVTDELSRFPRAGEIDQLRKEFAEPRGLNPRGRWESGATYYKLDLVAYNGDSYVANEETSEKPSRTSSKWTLNAARGQAGGGGFMSPAIGDYTASMITNVPAGTIAATNVQDAINELAADVDVSQNTLDAFVTNAESVAITKGQVVYAFGATGNRMSVKRAINTGDATSAKTIGVVLDSSIAAGATGNIRCVGVVDGLTLGSYTEGDTVYLGATAGSITATKPYAPNHLVYVGIVERANNGNGELYVKIQNGYELDEIHDVQIASAPLAGALLMRDATNSLWKANRLTGTANQVTVTNADTAVTLSLPTSLASVDSVTASASTALTLTGGTSGASLVLGQGTSGHVVLAPQTSGVVQINPAGTRAPILDYYRGGVVKWEAYVDASDVYTLRDATNGVNVATLNQGTSSTATFKVVPTTASTSTTSGALQVAGGVGVSGAGYFGGGITSTASGDSSIQLTSTAATPAAQTWQWRIDSATGNMRAYDVTGSFYPLVIKQRSVGNSDIQVASTTASTTTTSGALTVAGGVGVSGAGYFGGELSTAGANGLNVTKGTATVRSIVAGGSNELYQVFPNTGTTTSMSWGMGSNSATAPYINTTASLTSIYGAGGTLGLTVGAAGAATFAGIIKPQQATTAGAPAYVKGAIYFDTTLNKLRVGGATAWETITSV